MSGTAVLLHTFFFATLDPLLPLSVMAELLEFYRRESMGEETSFAHSCTSYDDFHACEAHQAQRLFVKLRMNAIYLNICSSFAAGRGDSYMDRDKRSPLECPEYAICFDRRGLLFALASGKDPTAAALPAKARLACVYDTRRQ